MGRRTRRALRRVPLSRKQSISFVLVGLMGLFQAVNSPEWLFLTGFSLLGLVLASDYDLLELVGLERLYHWVEADEDLLTIVERNYYAKRFVESEYERIPLTYWRDGRFRAMIRRNLPVKTGMQFLVKVDVQSSDPNDELPVPLRLCSAVVTRVVEADGDGREIRLEAVRWWGPEDASDRREREQYERNLQRLREHDESLEPYVVLEESQELDRLDLDEWRTLYESLDELGDDLG